MTPLEQRAVQEVEAHINHARDSLRAELDRVEGSNKLQIRDAVVTMALGAICSAGEWLEAVIEEEME